MKKLNSEKDFAGWESRFSVRAQPETIRKEKTDDGEMTVVEAIITTEKPAEVVDWEKWEMVNEILLMDGAVLPDTKQIPLLDSHCRFDLTCMKGSIRNLRIESDKLIGDVYFATDAEKEIKLVKEGHLTDLSVGYKISNSETVEIQPGQKLTFEVKGKNRTIKNKDDKKRLLVRTKWWVKEGSLVSIGADDTAKFRSELQPKPSQEIKTEISFDEDSLETLDQLFKKVEETHNEVMRSYNEINQLKQTINLKENKMPEPKPVPEKTEEQKRKEERERIAGINSIANELVSQKLYKGGKEGLAKVTKQATDEEWSVDMFRAHVWENLKNEDIYEKPVTDLDMSPKEYNGLSIGRAVEAMLKVREGDISAWDKLKAGKEKEAIDETRKRVESLPGVEIKGFPIPMDFFKNKDIMKHSNVLKAARRNAIRNGELFGQRASDGIGVTDAQYLIGTENMFNEFIDVLRNIGVAGPWGVRMVSGAKQNISVPKKTSTGTFHWVAESGTGTATDFVIGQLTATPHNGWSSMKRTRQAAYQSVPALDALIIDDIMNNTIIGRDAALLHGTGASNEPTGIDHTSGIGDVVGASLDWDAMVEFWTDVKSNNINSANLRYVTNALVAGKLLTRPVVPGQTLMLWNALKEISAPPIISEQVAANNLFYGDGSEAWMIDWGVIDLLVNPYKDDTGDVVFTVFSAMDVLVSRANAFSLADDVS